MKDLLRRIVITITLSAIFAGISPPPARAIFGLGDVVHDPVTLAAEMRQWTEELRQWLETVEFYTRQIEQMVESVTNLKGILKTVEDTIGFNKQMLQTISDIGRTIRAAFQVKIYLKDLVYGRMRAVARIHDRLANGVFDPDQIKQDLKDYFTYEIGQLSERKANDIQRLEQMDQQLQLLDVELTLQGKRIAEAEKSAKETDEKLKQIESNPEGVTQVDLQLMQLRSQQREFEERLARDRAEYLKLQREYLVRKKRIAEHIMESRGFGDQISEINNAWEKMTQALNKLRTTSGKPKEENQKVEDLLRDMGSN
jgi:hypothetical protein